MLNRRTELFVKNTIFFTLFFLLFTAIGLFAQDNSEYGKIIGISENTVTIVFENRNLSVGDEISFSRLKEIVDPVTNRVRGGTKTVVARGVVEDVGLGKGYVNIVWKAAGIKNVIVVQNKIDLVTQEQALENYNQIKKFLEKTSYKDAPIIPISALHKINIDLLVEAIEKTIPTPQRDPNSKPAMYVARSFDVNKPGSTPDKIVGGVLGGTLKQGILKVGEDIEIRPGRRVVQHNKTVCHPILAKITGLHTGGSAVEQVHPGGSIGVMTSLDPSVAASDNLVGSVVGKPGTLPETSYTLKLKTLLLERVVGAKDALVVKPLAEGEVLMLNVNSASTVGVITDLRKNVATLTLKLPICAEVGSKVTVSRNLGSRWRLIGYGTIQK